MIHTCFTSSSPRLLLYKLFAIVALCVSAASATAETALPSFEQVKARQIPSDALLLDRHGTPLADVRLNPQVRRLEWVSLAQLSPAMREALLAAEDKRFFEHSGVDWRAFAAAAWQNLWQSTKRGASTLTMQLAGLLDPALQAQGRRSLAQKWDQGFAALELEKRWTKEQILEAYLNLAPFRGDLQGVEAASQMLFGIAANTLTHREAAILSALLRGPNARPAVVARRACVLVAHLGRERLCSQIKDLAANRLNLPRNRPRFALAPHLARQLLRQPGQVLKTNLDSRYQRLLSEALERLQPAGAAAILLDNSSGEVLAWIGGGKDDAVDGVSLKRALPDWWWPHLAAAALERRQFTAASPLFPPIMDLHAASSSNWLSLRSALAKRNSGAMRYLLQQMPRDWTRERLRAVGIESYPPENVETSVETTLAQLAASWRSQAAGGSYVPARLLPGDNGVRRAMSADTAFLLQELLGDTNSSPWTASWSSLSPDGQSAVVVGHTEHHTLAMALRNTSSPRNAWRLVAVALDSNSIRPLQPTEGVVSGVVSFSPADEAARREWFLRGTELSLVVASTNGRRARIVFPLPSQAYPPSAETGQEWSFVAEASTAIRWQLNGKPLGDGPQVPWQTTPGRHRVRVLDVNDEVLDTIDFEVRGPQQVVE